jgi:hypothetical protein
MYVEHHPLFFNEKTGLEDADVLGGNHFYSIMMTRRPSISL